MSPARGCQCDSWCESGTPGYSRGNRLCYPIAPGDRYDREWLGLCVVGLRHAGPAGAGLSRASLDLNGHHCDVAMPLSSLPQPTPPADEIERYTRTAVLLHWLIAAAI